MHTQNHLSGSIRGWRKSAQFTQPASEGLCIIKTAPRLRKPAQKTDLRSGGAGRPHFTKPASEGLRHNKNHPSAHKTGYELQGFEASILRSGGAVRLNLPTSE